MHPHAHIVLGEWFPGASVGFLFPFPYSSTNEIRVDEQYNFPTVLYTTAYVLESQHVFITKKTVLESKESDVFCYRIPLSAA